MAQHAAGMSMSTDYPGGLVRVLPFRGPPTGAGGRERTRMERD